MVRIEAFIRPSRLDEVQEALEAVGVGGMSVIEILGVGRQKGYSQFYRGREYKVNFLPKLQLIVVVKDEDEEKVVNAIEAAARTGEVGDGKIFVMPIARSVRIRTGEYDDDALK